MGTIEDPKYFKLNIDLKGTIIEGLLREFIDGFTWNYKELKGIPSHIAEHKIELDTMIPLSHQVHYCMNPNYAMVIKQNLVKLLATSFIKPIEHKFG